MYVSELVSSTHQTSNMREFYVAQTASYLFLYGLEMLNWHSKILINDLNDNNIRGESDL